MKVQNGQKCRLDPFGTAQSIFARLALHLGTHMFGSHFTLQNTHSHFRNSHFTRSLLVITYKVK